MRSLAVATLLGLSLLAGCSEAYSPADPDMMEAHLGRVAPPSLAVVTGFGSGNPFVTMHSLNSGELLHEFGFESEARGTHGVAVTKDGATAFFSSTGGGLYKVDLKTGEHLGSVVLHEGGRAWGIRLSRDGMTIFVGVQSMSAVAVVDAGTLEVLDWIELPPVGPEGFWLQGMYLSSNGKLLYVLDLDTGTVAVIDVSSDDPEPRLLFDVNEGWHWDATSLYVVEARDLALVSSYTGVRVVDLTDFSVIKHIECTSAYGIAPGIGEREFLIACRRDQKLLFVDARTWEVTGEVAIEGDPHRVATDASGRFAVVSSRWTGELTVVDTRRREVIQVMSAQGVPWELEVIHAR